MLITIGTALHIRISFLDGALGMLVLSLDGDPARTLLNIVHNAMGQYIIVHAHIRYKMQKCVIIREYVYGDARFVILPKTPPIPIKN